MIQRNFVLRLDYNYTNMDERTSTKADDLEQVSERVFQNVLGTGLGDDDGNDGRHHKGEKKFPSE
jgi:hypothetical protein